MIKFELVFNYMGEPPESYTDDEWFQVFNDLRETFPCKIRQDMGLGVFSDGYVDWPTISEDLTKFSLKYPRWIFRLDIIAQTVFIQGISEPIDNNADYEKFAATSCFGLDDDPHNSHQ